MSRLCLLCLVAVQIAVSVETDDGESDLECVYRMCVMRRREGRTLVGCLVNCTSDGTLVFSGTCNDWFGVFSWWYVKNVKTASRRESKVVKIGLAYYFSGYIIRPISSKFMDSLSWKKDNSSQLSGSARCWKKGANSGGSVKINVTDGSMYVLSVGDGGGNGTWQGNYTNLTGVSEILMTNLTQDVDMLRRCADIVNAVVVGHSSSSRRSLNSRVSVIRKDPCSGATFYPNWPAVWTNWTKYGEVREFCQRDVAFHLSVHAREGGNALVNMTGMFIVSAGAFCLLSLLCCMSARQRRSIVKDFQGRSSLKSGGDEDVRPMTASRGNLRRVSL